MMKKIFIGLILTLCSFVYSQEDQETFNQYHYKGKLISEKKFNTLFEYFKEYLYSHDNEVLDLRQGIIKRSPLEEKESPNKLKELDLKPSIGRFGAFSSKILQVLNKRSALLDAKKTTYYRRYALRSTNGSFEKGTTYNDLKETKKTKYQIIYLKNYNTENKYDGNWASGVGYGTGTYSYSNTQGAKTTVPEITPIYPISKEQFATYINNEKNPLFHYKKHEKITQKAVKGKRSLIHCEKCNDKGKIRKSNYKQVMKTPYIRCPKCHGEKRYTTIRPIREKKETYWTKIEVK